MELPAGPEASTDGGAQAAATSGLSGSFEPAFEEGLEDNGLAEEVSSKGSPAARRLTRSFSAWMALAMAAGELDGRESPPMIAPVAGLPEDDRRGGRFGEPLRSI